jgi:hypothetical protein
VTQQPEELPAGQKATLAAYSTLFIFEASSSTWDSATSRSFRPYRNSMRMPGKALVAKVTQFKTRISSD